LESYKPLDLARGLRRQLQHRRLRRPGATVGLSAAVLGHANEYQFGPPAADAAEWVSNSAAGYGYQQFRGEPRLQDRVRANLERGCAARISFGKPHIESRLHRHERNAPGCHRSAESDSNGFAHSGRPAV